MIQQRGERWEMRSPAIQHREERVEMRSPAIQQREDRVERRSPVIQQRAMMRRENVAAPGRETREPKLDPPIYKAGRKFSSFLDRFERYLRRANIERRDLQEHLLDYINDDTYYDKVNRLRYTEVERTDPAALIRHVRAATVKIDNDSETNRMRLQKLKQAEGETIEEFAERIRTASEHAFPGENDAYVNRRMLEVLQDGLRERRVAEVVYDRKMADWDFETVVIEAIQQAARLRIFRDSERDDIYDRPVYKINGQEEDHDIRSTQEQAPIVKTCSNCEKRGHSIETCWKLTKCQLCDEMGHIAKYCWRSNGKQKPAQQDDSGVRWPNNNNMGSSKPRYENWAPNRPTENYNRQRRSNEDARHTRPEENRDQSDHRPKLCYTCGQPGHIASYCPTTRFGGNTSHVRQVSGESGNGQAAENHQGTGSSDRNL